MYIGRIVNLDSESRVNELDSRSEAHSKIVCAFLFMFCIFVVSDLDRQIDFIFFHISHALKGVAFLFIFAYGIR